MGNEIRQLQVKIHIFDKFYCEIKSYQKKSFFCIRKISEIKEKDKNRKEGKERKGKKREEKKKEKKKDDDEEKKSQKGNYKRRSGTDKKGKKKDKI